MNQKKLINEISKETGHSSELVQDFFNTFKKIVIEELAKGEQIKIAGFLHLAKMTQDERSGVHPRTQVAIKIKSHFKVQTRIGKSLIQAVNRKRPTTQQLQVVRAKKAKVNKEFKMDKVKIPVIDITKNNVSFQVLADDSRIMKARINC